MFDPKVLLDAMVAGSAHRPQDTPQPAMGGGGLGDILGQLAKAAQGGQAQGGGGGLGDILGKLGMAPAGGGSPSAGGGGGIGDIGVLLRKLGVAPGGPSAPQTQAAAPQGGGQQGGGLGDLMGSILGKLNQGAQAAGQAAGQAGQQMGAGAGGLGDILGQVFGQATQGAREGATRINEATGAGDKLDEIVRQLSGGKSSPELVAKIRDLIQQNQLGAGAAAGGLGALVLGSKAGRSLALDAAKLGGLVLIGGLAYKAYQNYSQGKPPLSPQGQAQLPPPAPAPLGSGFEANVQTPDHALLYIRAMIAAAAADGEIDEKEQEKIFGSLKQVGMSEQATAFLQKEIQNPATAEELAEQCDTPEAALEVYTAARIAIEPHSQEEQQFLQQLREALQLDANLAAHIDAQATSLKS